MTAGTIACRSQIAAWFDECRVGAGGLCHGAHRQLDERKRREITVPMMWCWLYQWAPDSSCGTAFIACSQFE